MNKEMKENKENKVNGKVNVELDKEIKKGKEWLKKQKFGKDTFIIILVSGILIFVILIPTGNKSSGKQQQSQQQLNKNYLSSEKNNSNSVNNVQKKKVPDSSYTDQLEQKLKTILEQMAGVGSVQIMITLSATTEEIVEKDFVTDYNNSYEIDAQGGTRTVTGNSSTGQTVYIIDNEGNKIPYISKTLEPSISGVLVIAEGGGNDTVRKNITEIIQALFGVEVHKIAVVKMKS